MHGTADDPVSVATLAACLPSDTGKLAYLEALSKLGSVEELSTAYLMGLTGLSHGTAKITLQGRNSFCRSPGRS